MLRPLHYLENNSWSKRRCTDAVRAVKGMLSRSEATAQTVVPWPFWRERVAEMVFLRQPLILLVIVLIAAVAAQRCCYCCTKTAGCNYCGSTWCGLEVLQTKK